MARFDITCCSRRPAEAYFAGAGLAGAGLTGCVMGDLTLRSTRPAGPVNVPWTFMKRIATTAIRSAPTAKASQGVALLFSPLSPLTTCVSLYSAMVSSMRVAYGKQRERQSFGSSALQGAEPSACGLWGGTPGSSAGKLTGGTHSPLESAFDVVGGSQPRSNRTPP